MILYYGFLFIILLMASFYFKFRNYIPILMYHRIAAVPGDRNALPPEKFSEQMAYLAQHGYTTITMAMARDYYISGKPLPPKPILLTFDDGYEDNFFAALPILQQYGLKGVVFPIGNWIGKENLWENFNKASAQTMDWHKLTEWQQAGMEIASHTLDHPFLANCPPDALQRELTASKQLLEEKLQHPIEFLCYPYGNFNQKVIAAARQSGYTGAFAIFDGVPLWKINVFALPRIQIPAKQPLWEFKLKVSSFHMIFIVMRKWEREFKRRFRQ